MYYNDFNDAVHLSFYSANKASQYFSGYLHENYDLPDHLADPAY